MQSSKCISTTEPARSIIILRILALWSFCQFLPNLMKRDMFMDGLLYSSVSHNLAEGLGTFWEPFFSQYCMKHFHEQLPMMFGLESIFFKLFGDSFMVERFYCLVMALLHVLFIYLIWKHLFFKQKKLLSSMEWLAVYFWIGFSSVHGAFENNLEECTMGFFAIASVFFQLKFVDTWNRWWTIPAAVTLLGSALCKGPQGLFPLAVVPIHWLVYRNYSFKRAFYSTLQLLFILLFIVTVLALNASVRSSFVEFFQSRIIKTFSISSQKPGDRFFILVQLFDNIKFPLEIFTVVVVIAKFKIRESIKPAIFLFLVGFAGILPLMVTLEQRSFYIVTALPYFALGFAVLIAGPIKRWVGMLQLNKIVFRFLLVVSIFPTISTFAKTMSFAGTSRNDKDLISDIDMIGNKVGKYRTIDIPDAMWNEWPLRCYFVR